jgi:hypothetical protein
MTAGRKGWQQCRAVTSDNLKSARAGRAGGNKCSASGTSELLLLRCCVILSGADPLAEGGISRGAYTIPARSLGPLVKTRVPRDDTLEENHFKPSVSDKLRRGSAPIDSDRVRSLVRARLSEQRSRADNC